MNNVATNNVTHVPPELAPRLRDRIEIELERDDKLFRFVSTIAELTGEDVIIDYPAAVEGGGVLMVGDEIRVSFTRRDGIYSYGSRVLHKDPSTRLRPMRISGPRQLARLQRRRFVRVELSGKCPWWALEEDNADAPIFARQHNGVLRSFSAGGLLFAADDPPEKADIILVQPNPDGLDLAQRIVASVVRVIRSDDATAFSHLVGVCFRGVEEVTASWPESRRAMWPHDAVGLSPRLQQKLIHYVYRSQIDLRKKGLL